MPDKPSPDDRRIARLMCRQFVRGAADACRFLLSHEKDHDFAFWTRLAMVVQNLELADHAFNETEDTDHA